jgi:NTP pyrophosphatase (non-canonical NTP hydrolase)
MDLNQYQQQARATAVYPDRGHNVIYPALGLAGETGEVVDKIKKVIRRQGQFTLGVNLEIIKELGDVLWYVAILASELGFGLDEVAQMNLKKLADRQVRDVLKGEGDDR